jgi:hypothetical protein
VKSSSPVQGILSIVCKIVGSKSILNGNRPEGLIHKRDKKFCVDVKLGLSL